MKKATFSIIFIAAILMFIGCSRGITIQEAANGKAKCGRYIR